MVREIPQLSPEKKQEMEAQHQALLAAYAEKKERLMQGDMTVLEDAFARLTERERKIIDLRFFKNKTQMEIAEVIGISQAQVSRLEKGALEKMRKLIT